ncbi:ATP-binding protein [Crossiella sp. SN42]|uniref:ATP-binding protein n=1 Tax=Crossiella sp. SN42 TaxID=2944808 RepID=UPI00207C77D6|nr:ATP-binding protein [Crossiella sp. SN42]MCO1575608.1 ATP-binding protein [Crossiella sp. SN42]
MTPAATWTVSIAGRRVSTTQIVADIPEPPAPSPDPWSTVLPAAHWWQQTAEASRLTRAIAADGLETPGKPVYIKTFDIHDDRYGPINQLAAAASILVVSRVIAPIDSTVLLGAVSDDGRICPAPGVLLALLAAQTQGIRHAIVPSSMLAQTGHAKHINVIGAASLNHLVRYLNGDATAVQSAPPRRAPALDHPGHYQPSPPRFNCDEQTWRLLAAAAAGGHHVLATTDLLASTPGQCAAAIAALAPALTTNEALQVAAIRSLTPKPPTSRLDRQRPYVSIHQAHNVDDLIGADGQAGLVHTAHSGLLHMPNVGYWSRYFWRKVHSIVQEAQERPSGKGHLLPPPQVQLLLSGLGGAQELRHVPRDILSLVSIRINLDHSHAVEGTASPETWARWRATVSQARERADRRWPGTQERRMAKWPDRALRSFTAVASVLNEHVRPEHLDNHQDLAQHLHANHTDISKCHDVGPETALRAYKLGWTLSDIDGTDQPTPDHYREAVALLATETPQR